MSWPENRDYYIWGTGNTALRVCSFFGDKLCVAGFLDNNKEKWGTEFLGCPVLNTEEFLHRWSGEKIIVASLAYQEILPELERRGLKEDVDFCDSRFFAGVCGWLWKQSVYMRRTDLSITSYCNLRCRHCNMLMPYYEERQHYDLEQLSSTVEAYFRWVDYVENFNILGGEPFLHPEVLAITQRIVNHYRSRIGELDFFTNGTVVPSEQMLELMREGRITAYIGDYRQGIGTLQPKVDAFVKAMEVNGISYRMPPSDVWVDFNHTETDRSGWDAKQLAEVCIGCRQPFRGLSDQKFYFCHLNASAVLSGHYSEDTGDYFDLSTPSEGNMRELVAFDLACIPKGYVSYCRHCGGCAPMNQHKIPVAEQLPARYEGGP